MRLAPAFLCAALGACTTGGLDASLVPVARPEPVAAAAPAVAPPQGPVSRALQARYAALERNLLAQGLLRRDGGGPDAMFSRDQLVENFVRIALFDEYRADADRLIQSETASRLRRWSGPVRIGVEFGPSVPQAVRRGDTAEIERYAARLARATGHPVSIAADPNFLVLVLREDERRAIGPRLRELVPGISDVAVRTIETMPPSILCLALAFAGGPAAADYARAVAIVRAEHTDLMRLACYHEEIAQGLGLANDSPAARPSIFNDDEEFATLTRHDELLLSMLYDRRLSTGMTAREALPIARAIASDLLGGGS